LKAVGLGSDSDILREEKNSKVHDGMMGKLVERGAAENIIEESWDSKRANVGVVVHDGKSVSSITSSLVQKWERSDVRLFMREGMGREEGLCFGKTS
jgi:hypothetical protein